MLKTGMRVNEIINLKEKDIDFELGRIVIDESGAARSRTLLIDQADLLLLKSWRDLKPSSSEYFFTTLQGARLKDRYIREMIKRLAKKSGITKDVYPHLLRYTFAIDFISEVKDIKLLQEALGHRELSATQLYTRLLFENSEQLNNDSPGTAVRSGMPLLKENQGSIVFKADSRETNETRSKIENAAASHALYENSARVEDCKEPAQVKITKHAEQVTAEVNGSKEPRETTDAGNNSGESKLDQKVNSNQHLKNKPLITVMPEAAVPEEKKRIPAIKCCRCNFIIHYQSDCPQCGTPLVETLRHWGKTV